MFGFFYVFGCCLLLLFLFVFPYFHIFRLIFVQKLSRVAVVGTLHFYVYHFLSFFVPFATFCHFFPILEFDSDFCFTIISCQIVFVLVEPFRTLNQNLSIG